MAGENYYYIFSLILLYVVALHTANLARIRKSGRTIFGFWFKPGTIEYKRLQGFASNRKLAIAILLEAVVVLVVIDSAIKVLRLGTPIAHSVLIFMPLFVAIFVVIGFLYVRKSLRGLKLPPTRKDEDTK